MSMTKIYKCNICTDTIKELKDSFGVNFSDQKNFTLGSYGCTDGQHICYGCARQLKEILNNEQITWVMEEAN